MLDSGRMVLIFGSIRWYSLLWIISSLNPGPSLLYTFTILNNGQLDRTLGAENLITKELLKYDNVRLYSFRGNSELICNLDNYKDAKHYGEWVNSQMLQWMKNDEYRITEENLAEYEKNADDLIKSYDYDQLFK